MISTMKPICLGLLLAGYATAQFKIHPDELKLKPKIDAAIEAGVEVLFNSQLRDGTWGRYGRYDGGKTALCAYALIKSGVSLEHQAVRRALLYIDGVRPQETYTIACMMLAYSATGSKDYRGRVRELSRLLMQYQRQEGPKKRDTGGDFGYPMPKRPDLSNTQYAALGLWVAQKHKIKIPSAVWRRLIQATLEYRSKPQLIKATTTGKHTVVDGGKVYIQGFGYTRNAKPTGSMTSAGVAILQICKIGLGGGLSRGRRTIDEAIDKGVAWLAHHFSVTSNPGKGASQLYYYLYGLERVGSLTRIEKMGDNWWYVRGARFLIRSQGRDGLWRGRGGQPEVQTAFALLFLRRATSGGAVTGRTAVSGTRRHLFSAGDQYSKAQIGGAGQQPLSLWVKGFGVDIKTRHKAHGIRVVQVEYILRDRIHGDRIIGQVAGDPTRVWTSDAFLSRVENLRRGKHRIRARVTLVAPTAARGSTSPTEVIESPVMEVEIRDVFAKWMEVAGKLSTHSNLLRTTKLTITATSNPRNVKLVADGNDATHWVCHSNDVRPEITIELSKPVMAKTILLTQAGARGIDRGQFDHLMNVEVFINKLTNPMMIEMDEDQLAVTSFTLPRRMKIHSLRFRIVLRLPGRRAHMAGFSEIALMK